MKKQTFPFICSRAVALSRAEDDVELLVFAGIPDQRRSWEDLRPRSRAWLVQRSANATRSERKGRKHYPATRVDSRLRLQAHVLNLRLAHAIPCFRVASRLPCRNRTLPRKSFTYASFGSSRAHGEPSSPLPSNVLFGSQLGQPMGIVCRKAAGAVP